jgi:hypothetical protein
MGEVQSNLLTRRKLLVYFGGSHYSFPIMIHRFRRSWLVKNHPVLICAFATVFCSHAASSQTARTFKSKAHASAAKKSVTDDLSLDDPSSSPSNPSAANPSPKAAKSPKLAAKPLRTHPAEPEIPIGLETALTSLGLSSLTAGPGANELAGELPTLAQQVVESLKVKSFLNVKVLDSARALTMKSLPADFRKAARLERVDGLIVGEISSTDVTMRLVSGKSGRTLSISKVPFPASRGTRPEQISGTEADKQKVIDQVVDSILQAIPYRGLVTSVGGGGVHLNLGSRDGILVGTHVHLYEFVKETPSPVSAQASSASAASLPFSFAKRDLGEIEITRIDGPTESFGVEVHHQTESLLFAKVAFDDKSVTTVAETRIPTRAWILAGGESMNITTQSVSDKYANKTYKMSQAPFLFLGFGLGKLAVNVKVGQAGNDDYSVTYSEIVGMWRAFLLTRGQWDFTGEYGGRFANFNVTAKRNTIATLESSSAVSPAIGFLGVYTLKSRLKFFAGAEIYYPVIYSGATASYLPYSLSAGLKAGGRLGLTPRLSFEFGARIKAFRRPIEGISSAQERQTSFFGGALFTF